MYTVVFAEQEHIDNIREYNLFLEPFLQKSRFTFCRWIPEESETLKESVPGLNEILAGRDEWRAVILCDRKDISKNNPFNRVEYTCPEWDESSTSMEDYYKARTEAKKAAYDKAADEPLVRLVTRLCEDPVIRGRGDGEEDVVTREMLSECEEMSDLNEDKMTRQEVASRSGVSGSLSYLQMHEYLEFKDYRACALYKKELRGGIRGEESLPFAPPNEIICIAERHIDDMDYALHSAWNNHDESEYSRFSDWNLYYDRMRYLVFDMEEETKQAYRSDYIRFLMGVLLIAGNDLPSGCLRPDRVYEFCCEEDEEKMAQLLGKYDAKLAATRSELEFLIRNIRTKQVERLSDAEAEQIFCANISIPVDLSSTYNIEELTCTAKFGLSFDCPVDDEEGVWFASYMKNRKAMKKLVKQPARAISRATDVFRQMNVLDESRAAVLNEYQMEDLKDHIDSQERYMVDTRTRNISDVQSYYDQMEEHQRGVREVMGKRMRKKITIFWGTIILALVFVGAIPFFLINRTENIYFETPISPAVILIILALVCVAAAAMIVLLVLRGSLMRRVRDYNTAMRATVGQMENDVKQHGIYLSHACNVMRGNSAVLYHDKHADGDSRQIRVLQKHMMDIEAQRANVKDIFGRFFNSDEYSLAHTGETAYDYDFTVARDYEYPLPAAPNLSTRIEFMERGNYVDIPYGIVRSLKVRREELYD